MEITRRRLLSGGGATVAVIHDHVEGFHELLAVRPLATRSSSVT